MEFETRAHYTYTGIGIDIKHEHACANIGRIPGKSRSPSLLKRKAPSMRQCMDSENLHRRLKKIIGQVQAIDRMIDEDVPCEDILMQINAAKSALHRCGQIVLEGHINHCVRDGIEHGDIDRTIESFTKAVERFANMGS